MAIMGQIVRATVFAVWVILFGFLAVANVYWEASAISAFLSIISLTLETFLICKMTSSISAQSPISRLFDYTFYESRDFAMVLPILSVLWALDMIFIGALTIVDLMVGGPVLQVLSVLWNFGKFGKFLTYVILVLAIADFVALFVWILQAGFRAGYRVVMQLKRPEDEAGVALIHNHSNDDEWNDWQDNNGR